jgi:hypothetical protein
VLACARGASQIPQEIESKRTYVLIPATLPYS